MWWFQRDTRPVTTWTMNVGLCANRCGRFVRWVPGQFRPVCWRCDRDARAAAMPLPAIDKE